MHRILVATFVAVVGSLVSVASPAQAASGPWSTASAGSLQACAVNTGKTLYCWGENGNGEVGDGTTTDRLSPTKIGKSGAWASTSAGGFRSCAITTGKSLYCWGQNTSGGVGDGTTIERHSPKKIGTSGAWASTNAGLYHTCAVSTAKNLYCWGWNAHGQIGDRTSGTDRPSPRKIGASGAWASANAGELHTCAVSIGKNLYCWGWNAHGQIGDRTSGTDRPSPRKIGASGVWASVDSGAFNTCALTTGKALYCWGNNGAGSVGDGTTDDRLSPKRIP